MVVISVKTDVNQAAHRTRQHASLNDPAVDNSCLINTTNMSSDFSDIINCFPKQRGFKMAFLNIVSLPNRFDEINFTMSNKLLI